MDIFSWQLFFIFLPHDDMFMTTYEIGKKDI